LKVDGITIREQQFALSKNNQRLFGLFALEMPGVALQDFRCVLGLRNSYDKSISSGLCVGASVIVCDNLSFNGEVTFARKHTVNLLRDLSWLITETVAQLPAKFSTQSETFNRYREATLSDTQAHDLIIRLMDEEAINLCDVRNVLKEWREPKHREFAAGGKTGWRLFNAATECIKGDLWRLPHRTNRLHRVLDGAFGVADEQRQPETVEFARAE
jgi:hypothetical protein